MRQQWTKGIRIIMGNGPLLSSFNPLLVTLTNLKLANILPGFFHCSVELSNDELSISNKVDLLNDGVVSCCTNTACS
jgi:hypothetical protein